MIYYVVYFQVILLKIFYSYNCFIEICVCSLFFNMLLIKTLKSADFPQNVGVLLMSK